VEEICEEAIDLDDVGVVDVRLYLEFAGQLLHHVVLSDFPLSHDLDGANQLALLLDG
jgi:hypothetical protein